MSMFNVELARKIKKAILFEPLSANMKCWVDFNSELAKLTKKQRNFCGTVGCIAGHVLIQSGLKKGVISYLLDTGDIVGVAAGLLGMDIAEAKMLFYFYSEDYGVYAEEQKLLNKNRPGTLGYAKVVVQALEKAYHRCGGEGSL